jgi:hypothetical protein
MHLIIKINNALPNILQLQNVYLTNSLNKINTPMKKLLLIALLFTAKIGFAQTYQQGDIFADLKKTTKQLRTTNRWLRCMRRLKDKLRITMRL